jgi:hypothetical protein
VISLFLKNTESILKILSPTRFGWLTQSSSRSKRAHSTGVVVPETAVDVLGRSGEHATISCCGLEASC